MEFVPIVAMAALVLKIIDFLRYVVAADMNGAGTQLIVWVAGIGTTFLAANTDWAEGIEVGGVALARLGFWSLVFVGLSTASVAAAGKDLLKSLDNSNSSKIPTLFPIGPKAPERENEIG